MKPADKRAFWPCIPVSRDGELRSVIFTQFELLDRRYPRATSGYAVESLVKKLAGPALRKRVGFDPEADMFAAYGDDPEALLAIARLIRKATGMRPPRATARAPSRLSAEKIRELIRRGYVDGLDPAAQRELLAGWARPENSVHDRLLRELRARDGTKRLAAARQILRGACRVVGNLESPLCHPSTLDAVMAAHARERDPKIEQELAYALRMLVMRALPDLRTLPVFERMLVHRRAMVRCAGLGGLACLSRVPWAAIMPCFDDKDAKVRAAACRLATNVASWSRVPRTAWITGDLALARVEVPREVMARATQ